MFLDYLYRIRNIFGSIMNRHFALIRMAKVNDSFMKMYNMKDNTFILMASFIQLSPILRSFQCISSTHWCSSYKISLHRCLWYIWCDTSKSTLLHEEKSHLLITSFYMENELTKILHLQTNALSSSFGFSICSGKSVKEF